jgi:putative membrane protein
MITHHWQRVSPIALVYFLVKIVKKLLGKVVYLIPAFYFSYDRLLNNPSFSIPILSIFLLLLFVMIFCKFYFFTFRIHENSLEIRSGIFAKRHINLPFERIQNVRLEQPIFYRPFNVACLLLDTAGSHKQEANIVAIDLSIAEQLKAIILASHNHSENINQPEQPIIGSDTHKDQKTTSHSAHINNLSQEHIINQRNLTDLIIHGLSNNRIWIFIGGLAPFFDNIIDFVSQWLLLTGINIESVFSVGDTPWWQLGFYAITLSLIILLPITFLSILGSIVSYYNFTLSKIGNRYIRRSGLITKHEVTMKISRLQMVISQQDWLDKLLNRINLRFEQNQSLENQFDVSAYAHKIIVPSVTKNQCQALIDEVYPDNTLASIRFTPISKRYLLRNIVFILVPLYLFLSVFVLSSNSQMLQTFITPLFFLLIGIVYLRWKQWGYACDNNYLYVRNGTIGTNYKIVPLYKVQQSQFKQSIFLRQHQLAHIRFVLASGSVVIPYLKQKAAYNLLNTSLYIVEKTQRPWM